MITRLSCLLLSFWWSGLCVALSFDEIQRAGVIKVGVYRDFAPYSFIDQGQAQGVDVELARRIADTLEVDLQLRWMIADENLDDDLRNHVWKGHYMGGGVVDLMLRVPYDRQYAYKVDQDGLVINDLVHLFGPYQEERWSLLYDNQQIPKFQTYAVFQYQPVAVEIDTVPDFYMTGAFQGRLREHVHHYVSLGEAVDALAQHKVSAVMGMRAQLQWFRSPLQRYQETVGPSGIGKQHWAIGMAVKDSYRQLAYAVTDIISAMVTSGEMAATYQHYGLTYEAPEHYLGY